MPWAVKTITHHAWAHARNTIATAGCNTIGKWREIRAERRRATGTHGSARRNISRLSRARKAGLAALTGWLCSLPCWLEAQELTLHAIAPYQATGQTLFLGAIFTEGTAPPTDQPIALDEDRALELRFVDTVYPSRFQWIWLEGLTASASRDELKLHESTFEAFRRSINFPLKRGDIIRFERSTRSGFTVRINGRTLLQTADRDFFDLLMRTWISVTPISAESKQASTNADKTSAKLRSQFLAITPAEQRGAEVAALADFSYAGVALVTAAKLPDLPAPDIGENTKVAGLATANGKAQAAPERSAGAREPNIDEPNNLGRALVGTAGASGHNLANSAPIASAAQGRARPTHEPLPVYASAKNPVNLRHFGESHSALAPAPAKRPLVNVAMARPARIELSKHLDRPLLPPADNSVEVIYVSDLMKLTTRNAEYPSSALRKGYEGVVRVAVTLDAKGNILDAAVVEKAQYRVLDKAALDAVHRAAPFPPMPATLGREAFTFHMPVVFKLQEQI